MKHTTPGREWPWLQTDLLLTDPDRCDSVLANHLSPRMRHAATQGVLAAWFFVRKRPWIRLRYQPTARTLPADVRQHLLAITTALQTEGHVSHGVHQIYEPEQFAFGGRSGMALAHRHFTADTACTTAYLAHVIAEPDRDRRREITLLLSSALMHAAGQERFEQGDIWAQVAQSRGIPSSVLSQPSASAETMTRFLIVDPDHAVSQLGPPLADTATSWLEAFRTTGTALRELKDGGQLERGIRAVLAHWLIFHWNRLGLDIRTQAQLATAAAQNIFADPSERAATTQGIPR